MSKQRWIEAMDIARHELPQDATEDALMERADEIFVEREARAVDETCDRARDLATTNPEHPLAKAWVESRQCNK